MTTTSTTSTNFISLIIIVILIASSSAQNANSTAVSLCSDAHNPALCKRILAGSSTGNLREMGFKAVKSTQSSVTQALDVAQALIKASKDPELIEILMQLSSIGFGLFGSHISEYSRVLSIASKKSAADLPVIAVKAMIELDCELFFLQRPNAPTEPAEIKAACDSLTDHADILVLIGMEIIN
ncbi:hypothetical protein CASFOL_030191 [Castilleja foliolosa]|uniref:Pectinesterase inhibitor domain-containing protein n=1 Tax=Castilleja foliolosa TaxID=1961234 RepID=A0ABD3CD53_9LAMI